ncbi:MAG: hypothetical protein KDK70_24780 [Myxococcales bacterium]|nr:hypothetical protein [Myxococcales bacterium]
MHTNKAHHTHSRRLAVLGVLAVLTVPTLAVAADPIAADADPTCEQSTVNLEIDVATGNVYLVDPTTGNLALTDNDITVSFGSLGHVLIMLHYSSSEWDVSVTPDDDPAVTYGTTNGWLRYSISDDVDQYLFESSEASTSMSTMMNMTPVVPDIIIRPVKPCPPPT